MTKFPKKLKDALALVRQGKLVEGKKALDEIEGFEAKKAIALAEVAYFQHDWAKGLELSHIYMTKQDEWHYSNIFDEHIELVLLATYKLNVWEDTKKFLESLLKIHSQNKQMIFQINKKLLEIKNKAKTIGEFENSKPEIRTKGKSLEEIEKQQKEIKPKLNNKPIEKADYILYFLHYYGNTADFIKVYDGLGKDAEKLNYENQKRAAVDYMAAGNIKKVQEVLLNCAKTWWPVEQMQVEPVDLFGMKELIPALDKKICEEILKMSKAEKA